MVLTSADVEALEPRVVGFFPKRTARRLDWPKTTAVEEVCSVSTCISQGPEGWLDHWLHNALGFFPSEDVARAVANEDPPADFDMYAYRMLPVAFPPGGEIRALQATDERAFKSAALAQDMPSGFERLGWDAAGNWRGWEQSLGFDCSPLTCNGQAAVIATNRHGLVSSLTDALEMAQRFGREQPEPGTYYLLEVWRKRRDGAAS